MTERRWKSSQRGDTRPPLARFQLIWACVLIGCYPDANQLSKCVEVCRQTILRDIEFMRSRLGFEISYDASRRGYFTRVRPNKCPFCGPADRLARIAGMIKKPVLRLPFV